ncbi:MAG: hypothetical protein WBP41_18425, partial [Saprospiraceae bacterium]
MNSTVTISVMPIALISGGMNSTVTISCMLMALMSGGINSTVTISVMPTALWVDIYRMSNYSAVGTVDIVTQDFNPGE